MIRIAICDDEKHYIDSAEKIISAHFHDKEIKIYKFDNKCDFDTVFESATALFDIIIMDVEMPDINGIEFAEYIRTKNKQTRIIYFTNYIEYATDVYDTEHTFYVLKKDAAERLPVALDKAMAQLNDINDDFILVDTGNSEQIVIPVKDIIYMERLLRETVIKTVSGKEITTERLDKLENKFRKNVMTRVHRSYFINMRHIKKLSGNDVIMSDSSIIHITRSYAKKFKEDFMNFIKHC
ncbi:MAG: response regulator transcription factor [Clostridia bacterium]|nr:response regulator transcription factor [Clostridia bacterium]